MFGNGLVKGSGGSWNVSLDTINIGSQTSDDSEHVGDSLACCDLSLEYGTVLDIQLGWLDSISIRIDSILIIRNLRGEAGWGEVGRCACRELLGWESRCWASRIARSIADRWSHT